MHLPKKAANIRLEPAFQGNGYWSCAAEGKGANGVVTAYVFKSAFQDSVTQGKGAPVFNPGFESKGKWSFAAEGKGKCSPAHVFNPAFTGPWNLAAKGKGDIRLQTSSAYEGKGPWSLTCVGKNCSPADVFNTAFAEDGCWYFTAEDTEGKGACSSADVFNPAVFECEGAWFSADVFNPALKGKGPCKGKNAGKRDLAMERTNDS